jgi:hypothetical protein
MFGESAGAIIKQSFDAISKDVSSENTKISHIVKNVLSHPFKIIAAFFTAPILIIRVALTVKNPVRRAIAVVGLLLAIMLSYLSGTLLGSLAGLMIVAGSVGILAAVGIFVGSALGMFFSVVFSVFIFNAVSYLFLRMSSQEVIDYLNEISK